MPKPQGKCIYCGGKGLTHEHLYADWIRKYLSTPTDAHGIEEVETSPTGQETRRLNHRSGDLHSKRIRRVCKTCNNGWMSQLQEAAKPLLTPMLDGDTITLNRQKQKIIAAWATMIAMTGEFAADRFVAVPQSDRDALRRTQRTPLNWRIWLGRFHELPENTRWVHRVATLAEKGTEARASDTSCPPNTQTTTICVGKHLLVHVMSSALGKQIVRRWNFDRRIAQGLRQIFPAAAENIVWPPPAILGPKSVWYVANEFSRRCEALIQRSAAMERPD